MYKSLISTQNVLFSPSTPIPPNFTKYRPSHPRVPKTTGDVVVESPGGGGNSCGARLRCIDAQLTRSSIGRPHARMRRQRPLSPPYGIFEREIGSTTVFYTEARITRKRKSAFTKWLVYSNGNVWLSSLFIQNRYQKLSKLFSLLIYWIYF